jgi:hypothetical protein
MASDNRPQRQRGIPAGKSERPGRAQSHPGTGTITDEIEAGAKWTKT